MNPMISVVMSVYNAQNYLSEAIESILNQTFDDFEFIIINDGSTDKSLDIINHYAKKDDRIIVISRENKGLIYSLNEGIKKAQGKYIARMDADDISLPQRFEKQLNIMNQNDDIGICGTSVIVFGNDIKEKIWKLSQQDSILKTELLFSSCFAHPTVMMRKKLIDKYDLYYSEKFIYAEDFELWTRFADFCKFTNIDKPLLKYRILDDSATRKADKDEITRYKVIKRIFNKYLKKLNFENNEEENILHFNLTVNHRIKKIKNKKILLSYFNKIIKANKKTKIFNESLLKKVLGKRWLWYMFYQKDFKALFSKYFFYGLIGIKK